MYSIGRTPRPRMTIGRTPRPRMTIEPPRQMAERLQQQLAKIAPSHPSLLLPYDAFLVDILEDSIREVEAARSAAQPVQDALTSKQQDKGRELRERYHVAWMNWKTARNDVRRIAGLKSQQIVRLLPVGWDEDKFDDISLSVSDPLYTSWEEGKRKNDAIEMSLWHIESRIAAMNAALAFANDDPAAQAKQMIYVIADDFMDLVKRVERLEAALREVKPISKRKVA